MHARNLTRTATLAIALTFSVTTAARADMIGRPADCPPGARSALSHSGARCKPATCGDGCGEGDECIPRRVCTVQALVQPGGMGGSNAPPFEEEQVVMTCAPTETCTGTEAGAVPTVGDTVGPITCRELRVCVRPTLPPFPPMPEEPAAPPDDPAAAPASGSAARASSGSCASCAIAHERGPTAGLGALLVCLGIIAYKRARR